MDIHVWCEHNGQIIDPYFAEYDMIRSIRKCHGNQQHMEQPEHRGLIMSSVKDIIKRVKKTNPGATTEAVLSEFAAKPQYGHCFLNAYAYAHAHRNDPNGAPRLCIGKMGWTLDNPEGVFKSVWWGFG